MARLHCSFCCLLCIAVGRCASAGEVLEYRWLYLQKNLQITEELPATESILRRAAKAGYNGVVLADYKLNVLERVPDWYFKNAARFREICRELNLEVIPAVASFGYSSGILAHDSNMAEGLPARDVPFVVKRTNIVLDSDNPNLVPGDFETHTKDVFAGWGYQDEPGTATFADSKTFHGGKVSMRIENPPSVIGNRRVIKQVKLRPWSQFHASVWIKTSSFESAGDTKMFAMSPSGRILSHSFLKVSRDQDWTEHHCVFNSLENTEVAFYVGTWDCHGGKMWVDDVRVAEEPFVNLVRRSGCPLTVKDESGKTVFVEGRDYAELRDTKLGVTPWPGEFEVYHTPPALMILPGSQLKDGQKLRVSFYHAVTIYDNQVPCSLTEPKVFEILEDQLRRTQKVYEPQTYFFSHDEIRVANWSVPEQASGKTAGQQLADNVRHCVDLVRRITPNARLCIWSDMFDPSHNAVKAFYLVNGNLAGSWEGLPPDMIIMNWNSDKAAESLKHFDSRGHRQILAGFYDAPPENIRRWLQNGEGLKGIRGAMYTTWQNDFTQLEKFAAAAWGTPK